MATALEKFKQHDFEHDEQWKEFCLRIEFPVGREDLVLKQKAKYFKKQIDPNLNMDEVIGKQEEPETSQNPTAEAVSAKKKQPTSRPRVQTKVSIKDVILLSLHLAFLGSVIAASLEPLLGGQFQLLRAACLISVVLHSWRVRGWQRE